MADMKNLKGMEDHLPERELRWKEVLQVMEKIAQSYGYLPVSTPLLQKIELYKRGLGEDTDVVNKEMYVLTDKGGRKLVLKPEETASIARMFNEHNLSYKGLPQRYYYHSSFYRQEKPQKGRLREFYQFGIEAIGSPSPYMDVEVISLFYEIVQSLGIEAKIKINSLGCKKCRPKYREELEEFLLSIETQLCNDCKRRLKTNPLRVLDCKNEQCIKATNNAPSIKTYLCEDCKRHHETVLNALEKLNIPFEENKKLVRGLDYYNRTIFEVESTNLGAQNAIGGGGRYDYLIEEFGGKHTPAVGFAIGMERIILSTGQEKTNLTPAELSVHAIDDTLIPIAMDITQLLRKKGKKVYIDNAERSLSAEIKQSDKKGIKKGIIVLSNDKFIYAKIKDLKFAIKDIEKNKLDNHKVTICNNVEDVLKLTEDNNL